MRDRLRRQTSATANETGSESDPVSSGVVSGYPAALPGLLGTCDGPVDDHATFASGPLARLRAGPPCPAPAAAAPLRRTMFINRARVEKRAPEYRELDGIKGADASQRLAYMMDEDTVDFRFAHLADAKDYLTSGNRLLVEISDRRHPGDEPPERKRPSGREDTAYELDDRQPTIWSVPQSPRREDGSERADVQLPVGASLDDAHAALGNRRKRGREAFVTETATENTFQYTVQLTYRLTEGTLAGGGWTSTGSETTRTVAVKSPIYHSGGTNRPAPADEHGPEAKKRRSDEGGATKAALNKKAEPFAAATREGIVTAANRGSEFAQFDKTAVRAHAMGRGKNDPLLATTKDANGKYLLKNQSIGMGYFHSEVQALGQAPKDVPALVATLLEDLAAGASAVGGQRSVVLNSLHVVGASIPNTICSNACKPALSALLNELIDVFVKALGAKKPALSSEGTYVRRSREFRAHMSASGVTQFPGFGTGAVLRQPEAGSSASGGAASARYVPSHGVVTEYAAREKAPGLGS